MRRIVFLAAASLSCVLRVSAQQHNIDTQKSTLTIHVGKTGAFSGLGHEHEVRAPIHSGTADTGSHPAVEMRVNARELRVIDKDDSDKDRAEVQKTMLGPEVLDSEGHQEIVFKSTSAESVGEGRWALHGNLTLRGQTRPITVQVTLKDGRYTGETTVKQSDPQKPGSDQKPGNQPNQPIQHQQQDPSGQPKSPQSEQEKHDQEKKKQA